MGLNIQYSITLISKVFQIIASNWMSSYLVANFEALFYQFTTTFDTIFSPQKPTEPAINYDCVLTNCVNSYPSV